MNMTMQSAQAYARGVKDGTIDDSINEIYNIVLEQEVVSYCNSKGSYTFDIYDFEVNQQLSRLANMGEADADDMFGGDGF